MSTYILSVYWISFADPEMVMLSQNLEENMLRPFCYFPIFVDNYCN